MPEFKLYCENSEGARKIFYYNTSDSSLKDESGSFVVAPSGDLAQTKGFSWDKENPAYKTKDARRVKISLGLSCNYSCSYCSQRFVPHADETAKRDVPEFLEKMPTWFNGGDDGKGSGTMIEFWGGEPLVYWKTIQPLAEGIRKLYPSADFLMITNGSILTDEMIEWIDALGFNIGLSHDGPAYHIRGDDPLKDPDQRKMIMKLWNRLSSQGRMSINAMIHKDNPSRAKVQEWLENEFCDRLIIGEGAFIDAYDEGGLSSVLSTPEEHISFRRMALDDIRNKDVSRFQIIGSKVKGLFNSIELGRDLYSVNQKCGIDHPENITVDLKGNVITCQNVSAVSTAPNGESHNCGSVYDIDNVKVKTIRSWNKRENCPKCPVIHICKGSCTFLEDELFTASCESSFSDNIVFLAVAVELMTGYLPVYIDGDHRDDRKDIWGLNGLPDIPTLRDNIIATSAS